MQAAAKRTFDIVFSTLGIVVASLVILTAWLVSTIDTGTNGIFVQLRVGRNGRLFRAIKIRTMRPLNTNRSTVTARNDPRITAVGQFFRRTKIDELPQLFNILVGNMSFVGPRPDVPGFADLLQGKDRVILSIRPGITGPATLKYRDEEDLLASVENPEQYNREVIYPDKIRINREYVENWSFRQDILYILATFSGTN